MSKGESVDVDIVIIGAGAAGLTAAIAASDQQASVAIIEKSDKLGGTAAISGGIMWVPNNPLMRDAGISDSSSDALKYFQSLNHGDIDEVVLKTFLDESPTVLDTLMQMGAMSASLLEGYPDYYMDRPGAKPEGGRALDHDIYSFKALGEWAEKVMQSANIPRMLLRETPLGGGTGIIPQDEMARRIENDERGWGQAMIGRLLKACLERGIEPRLSSNVKRLERSEVESWRVDIESSDQTYSIHARKGVIISTGGFEWDEELKQTFLRGPLDAPASPPTNTGDGLKLAMSNGAALGNMTSSWWVPTLSMPGDEWPDGSQRSLPVLIERTLPHTIMVNKYGKRFCNEANNYSALAGAFHSFDPATYDYPNRKAYLIFDNQYRSKYPIATVMPGTDTPNWLTSAPTLRELAQLIDVDAQELESTVNKFNTHADEGHDPDFNRGDGEYDRFYGDRSREGASATLGQLIEPPYFAVELKMGTLGTNGGAKTNEKAQVLDVNGNIIPGLFAAGNVMAGATGGVYAGAGGTLGPAITFGFVAGREAAS